MKIKILQGCSGINFSFGVDEIVDVANEIGKDLVDGGLAEEVKTASKSKVGVKADADT